MAGRACHQAAHLRQKRTALLQNLHDGAPAHAQEQRTVCFAGLCQPIAAEKIGMRCQAGLRQPCLGLCQRRGADVAGQHPFGICAGKAAPRPRCRGRSQYPPLCGKRAADPTRSASALSTVSWAALPVLLPRKREQTFAAPLFSVLPRDKALGCFYFTIPGNRRATALKTPLPRPGKPPCTPRSAGSAPARCGMGGPAGYSAAGRRAYSARKPYRPL